MGNNKGELKQVRKKIYSMIIPITIENVLQMTAGFISMAMIGRLDAISIAALGISTRITQIIWSIFKGITTGGSVFVAQAYGAKDFKKIRHVIQQTILSSIALVIILQQIIYWKAESILKIFKPRPELMDSAISYMKIVSLGLPFMVIMLIVAGVLQAMGNAKTPMKIALIMNISNIIFSFILIFGKLGLPVLGLKGAAIGMIIAQFTAAVIGLYILFNKDGVLNKLCNKDFFNFDIKEIKEVYRVGMPTAFESVFWQISAIILTKIILSFGEIELAAYQMGLQAESISYMPAMGFGVAATAFIGQAVGAKDEKLTKNYMRELVFGSCVVTSISTIILVFFPKVVMNVLTSNTEVINIGIEYLFFMGLVQIPQNISGVLNGALRGAGFTKVPMYVAGIGLWIIRIPLSLYFTYKLNLSITFIWIAMCADLISRFVISTVLYKRRGLQGNVEL